LISTTLAALIMVSGSVPLAGATAIHRSAAAPLALPFATGENGLELTLTKVTPAAAGPDDDVVVTGTVRNPGSTTVKNARISLWMRSQVLADRESIDSWLTDGVLTSTDRQLATTFRVRTLGAGATAQFQIQVPPGETGLTSGDGFGPRAIALQVRT
jgi:hypothetical protein